MSVRPEFVYVFRLSGGEEIRCPQGLARRTVDRREPRADPETVWEVHDPSGLVRRLWPDDIAGWDQVPA